MDKPLKYFLIASVVFFAFIAFILIIAPENEKQTTKIPKDYPLLISAEEQAAYSIDTFFKYYPDFPDNSFVKFRSKAGDLWGRVIFIKEGNIRAEPMHVPISDFNLEIPKEIDLATEELLDWLIELPNGMVRGGYTSQAIFIYEKTQTPSATIDSQLNLFVDKLLQER